MRLFRPTPEPDLSALPLRPRLQDPAQARDLVAAAIFCLVAPGFHAPGLMWRPETVCALSDAINALNVEARQLELGIGGVA
jgi:hypothetical protein